MSRWPGNAKNERTSFGGLSRSQLMSRVRSKSNQTTELVLALLLRDAGLTGWRRNQRLVGRPDFVWSPRKLAVFVDGCFWHGHDCGKNISPKTNSKAWRDKIRRNKARDLRVASLLRRQGWSVIRIWECQLAKNPDSCLNKIRRFFDSGSRRSLRRAASGG